MERRCKYRKCQININDMRTNAIYCSRSCKTNERKYNKRADDAIVENKKRITELLFQIENTGDEIKALFMKIHGK